MHAHRTQTLSGWGRHPVESCHLLRPDRRSALTELLAESGQRTLISRGFGRSYGDASLNRDGGVVSHLKLNRLLEFDAEEGVLECEAGASLAEIV